MLNPDTEIMFPIRLIPALAKQRKEKWKDLVDSLSQPDVDLVDQTAFVLMVVRLSGCIACNADAFRAMRGCTLCSKQTVRRYRGSDDDLVVYFQQCRKEIMNYLQKVQKKEK